MTEPSKRRVSRSDIALIEKGLFVVGVCDEGSPKPEGSSALYCLLDAEIPSPRISKSMEACAGVISAEFGVADVEAMNSA